MKSYFLILFLVSLSFAKYSYSDKCYRYLIGDGGFSTVYLDTSLIGKGYYQYYVSKKGNLLSKDEIIHEYSSDKPRVLSVQYYFQ